jgi:uncharacterized SAM-binding protein YcdF (DUF218 family)
MFFAVSKTLGFLCNPLWVSLVVLALFGLRLRRRYKGAAGLFWFGLIVLYACSTGVVSSALMRPLEGPYRNAHAPPSQVGAIVVLGGSLDLELSTAEHSELRAASDRFVDGVRLARRFPDAKLVFSGGTAELVESAGPKEATLLKKLAVELGILEQRILVEDKSRNTRENATATKVVIDREHLSNVVLVTSAYHMRRALACFRAVGVNPTPYATDFKGRAQPFAAYAFVPDIECLSDSNRALREYVGLQVYRRKGWLHESSTG